MTPKIASVFMFLSSLMLGVLWLFFRTDAMLVTAVLMALWSIYLSTVEGQG